MTGAVGHQSNFKHPARDAMLAQLRKQCNDQNKRTPRPQAERQKRPAATDGATEPRRERKRPRVLDREDEWLQ